VFSLANCFNDSDDDRVQPYNVAAADVPCDTGGSCGGFGAVLAMVAGFPPRIAVYQYGDRPHRRSGARALEEKKEAVVAVAAPLLSLPLKREALRCFS